MAPLVFKTSGRRSASPAGSIPVRLRYLGECRSRLLRVLVTTALYRPCWHIAGTARHVGGDGRCGGLAEGPTAPARPWLAVQPRPQLGKAARQLILSPRLSDQQIAAAAGYSVTPVREARERLARVGVIPVIPPRQLRSPSRSPTTASGPE